jgi:hypothetical protein
MENMKPKIDGPVLYRRPLLVHPSKLAFILVIHLMNKLHYIYDKLIFMS